MKANYGQCLNLVSFSTSNWSAVALTLLDSWTGPGLGSITIVIVIDCNRLQLERNRNQIFQIVV